MGLEQGPLISQRPGSLPWEGASSPAPLLAFSGSSSARVAMRQRNCVSGAPKEVLFCGKSDGGGLGRRPRGQQGKEPCGRGGWR